MFLHFIFKADTLRELGMSGLSEKRLVLVLNLGFLPAKKHTINGMYLGIFFIVGLALCF